MEDSTKQCFGEGEGELVILHYPKPLPMRLDRWLVSQRSEQSRARIQKFINEGLVKVNEKIGKAKTPLRQGDEIKLWLPPPEPLPYLKPEKISLDILYEDKYLIVINKQAGIAVHPAPGNKFGTLVNGLLHHCNDLPGISGKLRPGIVHRLDKDTTGCIVVAKTQEALVNLQKQIQTRVASRIYLAIVHGVPKGDKGTIIGAIGRHPVDRKKYAVVTNEMARYACTHWELKERLGDYSLLSFKLDTGRTHQIRVHCAHFGHPILGDQTYSRCKKLPNGVSSQVLHAVKLGLKHPHNNETMLFEAPLPNTFKNVLTRLQKRLITNDNNS
ncbi:RluA family pseudouridine synthase [Prochlorococcus marinus]|uniref:Pseudouridine synthase n=1 Tax=Prochlorococcus marinus (strain MIT 9211) TaxID=93059 RepID=A9BDF6_PROM4|nr:RluA family pseudouridine synthase [Prochlorococcus marinus]ABX08142.1 putative pseudouridylate synthase specific to ribosomal large subunit [Prochlorococcus marinus str. MIT 9211]